MRRQRFSVSFPMDHPTGGELDGIFFRVLFIAGMKQTESN